MRDILIGLVIIVVAFIIIDFLYTEKNTYFSSLLSQTSNWDINGIIKLAKRLLEPFDGLKGLEPSGDVSMLEHIGTELPYKIGCYKSIISSLYENNGMDCDELSINAFNDYCGVDVISFIHGLISKGYDLKNIKSVRLFYNNNESLQRALLLCKSLFPSLKVEAFNSDTNNIANNTKCDSLLTINLFPHTLKIRKDVHKVIAKLIIKSYFILVYTN